MLSYIIFRQSFHAIWFKLPSFPQRFARWQRFYKLEFNSSKLVRLSSAGITGGGGGLWFNADINKGSAYGQEYEEERSPF